MSFEWARAVAIAGLMMLAACGRNGNGVAAMDAEVAANNLADAEAFLARNATAEGVVTLPSGLQYKVVRSGPPGGESPDGNDLVRVHYEGALADGTVFDSSYRRGQPYVTTPEDVVPGWTEALQKMKVGDQWLLFVPPALGYKDQATPDIPPNSLLVFRIELLDVATAPGRGSTGTARV